MDPVTSFPLISSIIAYFCIGSGFILLGIGGYEFFKRWRLDHGLDPFKKLWLKIVYAFAMFIGLIICILLVAAFGWLADWVLMIALVLGGKIVG